MPRPAPCPALASIQPRIGCSHAAAVALRRSGGATSCIAASASAAANRPSSGSSRPSGGGGLNNAVPAQHTFATRTGGSSCSTRGRALYNAALEYARQEQYDIARRVFEKTVAECPGFLKPWVSWAQMEKRCNLVGQERDWASCRAVLQQGLLLNRDAPALLQAWGLMEMQRGNWLAALLLLDRSARLEPRNRPVLRWRPVVEARQTVGARRGAGATKPRLSSQASDS